MEKKGRAEWAYKEWAIKRVAELINSISDTDQLTFVPVPPSKSRQDPLYDERLTSVLQICQQTKPATDFREMVYQKVQWMPHIPFKIDIHLTTY